MRLALFARPSASKRTIMTSRQFAFVISLTAASLFAQTLSQKIEVSVVNVDGTVTTPAGAPVRGLTRDDFQLFEDGVPQPITNFYGVESAPPAAVPTTLATTAAPQPQEDQRFRRKVLLLIDNNHLSKRGRDVALQQIESFVNDRFHGGEYDWSVAAIGSHAGIVMPLSSDKKRIHATLEAIRFGGSRAHHSEFGGIANGQMRDVVPPTELR